MRAAEKIKEKPILFSPLMAQKVYSGEKTQTRRLVKPQPPYADVQFAMECDDGLWRWYRKDSTPWGPSVKSRIQVGDRLWVRESCWIDRKPITDRGLRAFFPDGWMRFEDGLMGASTGREPWSDWTPELRTADYKLNPSMRRVSSLHMPYWACRSFPEVTRVRVERVESITDGDALAEGFRCKECGYTLADAQLHMDHNICEGRGNRGAASAFIDYFYNVVNRAAPKSNPWVWVYDLTKTGAQP